jgi:hypothetical protein
MYLRSFWKRAIAPKADRRMLRLEEGVRSTREGLERFPAVPKAVGKPVFGDPKSGM